MLNNFKFKIYLIKIFIYLFYLFIILFNIIDLSLIFTTMNVNRRFKVSRPKRFQGPRVPYTEAWPRSDAQMDAQNAYVAKLESEGYNGNVPLPPYQAKRFNRQQRDVTYYLEKVGMELSRAFQQAMSNPLVFATIALAVIVVVSEITDLDSGPLKPWFPEASKNKFIIWVRANIQKIIGIAVFLPVMVDLPRRSQLLILLIPIMLVLLPKIPTVEYALLALLTHFFLHVNGAVTRFLIILVGVAMYLFGILFSGFPHGRM